MGGGALPVRRSFCVCVYDTITTRTSLVSGGKEHGNERPEKPEPVMPIVRPLSAVTDGLMLISTAAANSVQRG